VCLEVSELQACIVAMGFLQPSLPVQLRGPQFRGSAEGPFAAVLFSKVSDSPLVVGTFGTGRQVPKRTE
jgi:hypothetical protein